MAWQCTLHRPRDNGPPHPAADGRHPWLARAVDRLGPAGRWTRAIVTMEAGVRGGVVVAMRRGHAADGDFIATVRPTSRLETARALQVPWTATRYVRQQGPSLALRPRVAPLRWRSGPARNAWRWRVGVADGGWLVGPGRSARRPVSAA